MPADPSSVQEIPRIALSADADAYAYSYTRELSTHLMQGVRWRPGSSTIDEECRRPLRGRAAATC